MLQDLGLSIEELVEGLQYKGNDPWATRNNIIDRGEEPIIEALCLMVCIRGTNIKKIMEKSKNPMIAGKFVNIAEKMVKFHGAKLGYLVSCFPELMFKYSCLDKSRLSPCQLAFLKCRGLSRETWMSKNKEFCDLMKLDYGKFVQVADVIWQDSRFDHLAPNVEVKGTTIKWLEDRPP